MVSWPTNMNFTLFRSFSASLNSSLSACVTMSISVLGHQGNLSGIENVSNAPNCRKMTEKGVNVVSPDSKTHKSAQSATLAPKNHPVGHARVLFLVCVSCADHTEHYRNAVRQISKKQCVDCFRLFPCSSVDYVLLLLMADEQASAYSSDPRTR